MVLAVVWKFYILFPSVKIFRYYWVYVLFPQFWMLFCAVYIALHTDLLISKCKIGSGNYCKGHGWNWIIIITGVMEGLMSVKGLDFPNFLDSGNNILPYLVHQ